MFPAGFEDRLDRTVGMHPADFAAELRGEVQVVDQVTLVGQRDVTMNTPWRYSQFQNTGGISWWESFYIFGANVQF